jgi:hypothetical protein
MNSIDVIRIGLNSARLAGLGHQLAAISERAHQHHGIEGVGPFAEEAVGLGRACGWRDGARRGTQAATTAVSLAAADQFATDPDTAILISDQAQQIWNTAGPPPTPSRLIQINGPDLAHGPGVVAVLGTIAYHDAWHGAHQTASADVLRTLDNLLDAPRHSRTWQQIRAAATDAVQADSHTGPFAAPPKVVRGFLPFRRGGDLVAWLGVDGSPRPQHRQEPGAPHNRSR